MSFTLHVDTDRWRAHQDAVLADSPALVPVAKGNGYGLGLPRLAAEAARLGVDTVAVGLPEEVAAVRAAYDGSVLVLSPQPPPPAADPAGLPGDGTVIRTVSHLATLEAIARGGGRPRVVIELETSMRRHGLAVGQLAEVARLLDGVTLEGFALHLPLVGSHLAECRTALDLLAAAGLPVRALWVSHLSSADVRRLAADAPGVAVRPRVGTRLWLGDRGALHARGTVLDVKRLRRGDRYGYRQRRAVAPGSLLVVSGGTAHGVGLEAPKPVDGLVPRAKVAAAGGLAAAGRSLSPFRVAGRQRWFAEPPHMQVSLVLLPARVTPPQIGDELDCEVRMTTSTFDRVRLG